MAVRILSLLLFLQVVFFPWLFLWSLHSFLNTWRGQFDHYFIVICVIIRLLSFPALKHCRRTDWSRILRDQKKKKNQKEIIHCKASARQSCHYLRGTTRHLSAAFLHNFHVLEKPFCFYNCLQAVLLQTRSIISRRADVKCKPKLMFSSMPL